MPMLVPQLWEEITRIRLERPYIQRVEVLALSRHILKVRLYITDNLFVQLYRNDGCLLQAEVRDCVF